MKIGDKLICINQIKKGWGWNIFEKDKTYDILHIDYDELGNITYVTLNHILHGTEYIERPIEWVNKNFKTIEELRDSKLNELGI